MAPSKSEGMCALLAAGPSPFNLRRTAHQAYWQKNAPGDTVDLGLTWFSTVLLPHSPCLATLPTRGRPPPDRSSDRGAVDGYLAATNALIDSTNAERSGVRLEFP